MIVGPSPSQRYTWSCPDCGKTGWSSTRHGAVIRLRAHWRGCPEPGPLTISVPDIRHLAGGGTFKGKR